MDDSDREFEDDLIERSRRRRGLYPKSSRWPAFPPPPRRRHRGRYLVVAVILLAAAIVLTIRHSRDRSHSFTRLGPGRSHSASLVLHSTGGNQSRPDPFELRVDPDTHILSRRLVISRNVTLTAFTAAAAEDPTRNPVHRIAHLQSRFGASGEWEPYEGSRFLAAPVVRSTPSRRPLDGEPAPPRRHHMFAIEYGTGAPLYATYRPGEETNSDEKSDEELAKAWARPWKHDTPGTWGWADASDSTSSSVSFAWQPDVSVFQVAAPGGQASVWLNVYGVTPQGAVMRRTIVTKENGVQEWQDDWLEIGSGAFGEVRVATDVYSPGGYDHVVAIKDGQYRHAHGRYTLGTWDGAWSPLGRPDSCRDLPVDRLGQPEVIAWDAAEVEIIVVCDGRIWHKTRNHRGEWSLFWEYFGMKLDYKHASGGSVRLKTHGLVSDDMWWRTLIVEDQDGETMYYTTRHKPRPVYGSPAVAYKEGEDARSHIFT